MLAAFAVLLAGCASMSEPPVRAPAGQITINGSDIFPESIASYAAGNIYVGSNYGTIFRARAGEAVATPWVRPMLSSVAMSVFGVLADDDRGLLWACANPAMGETGGAPEIRTYSLLAGVQVDRYPLATGDGPAMCNDITLGRDGAVYASEMLGGRILRLAPGGTVFEIWASMAQFAPLDGISFAADGTLYANAIQHGKLLRIGTEANGLFGEVEEVPTDREMITPDGLRPLPDGRMLQSEGNAGLITVIAFKADGSATVTPIAEGVDYASSVTPVGGRAYFPEGKLRFLFGPDAGKDPGTFVIRSVAIPEVP